MELARQRCGSISGNGSSLSNERASLWRHGSSRGSGLHTAMMIQRTMGRKEEEGVDDVEKNENEKHLHHSYTWGFGAEGALPHSVSHDKMQPRSYFNGMCYRVSKTVRPKLCDRISNKFPTKKNGKNCARLFVGPLPLGCQRRDLEKSREEEVKGRR